MMLFYNICENHQVRLMNSRIFNFWFLLRPQFFCDIDTNYFYPGIWMKNEIYKDVFKICCSTSFLTLIGPI